MKYQLVTYKNAALNPPAASRTSIGDAIAANTSAVISSVVKAAGSRSRNRRAQNRPDRTPPPASIDPARPGPATGTQIAQQQARDQEPGQDEEHVHTDEPAREPAAARMEQHHQIHGHRAQTIQIRPVPIPPGRRQLRASL